MSRKGAEWVLVALIIALAFALVGGIAINLISVQIKGSTDKEICRNSVQLNAQKVAGIQTFSTPINCPSNDLIIKDEKNAKAQIANAMYDCWYKFGEGKLDFMGSDKGSFCYLCSKINFDESLKSKEITGLGDYLLETKTSTSEQTYADYLFTNKKNLDFSPLNKITTNNPLYILYVFDTTNYPRPPSMQDRLTNIPVGCAIGGAIGVWFGLLGAVPGCILGSIGYGIVDIKYSSSTFKFNPYLYLNWNSDNPNFENVCSGKKSFLDEADKKTMEIVDKINSYVPEGDYSDEGVV